MLRITSERTPGITSLRRHGIRPNRVCQTAAIAGLVAVTLYSGSACVATSGENQVARVTIDTDDNIVGGQLPHSSVIPMPERIEPPRSSANCAKSVLLSDGEQSELLRNGSTPELTEAAGSFEVSDSLARIVILVSTETTNPSTEIATAIAANTADAAYPAVITSDTLVAFGTSSMVVNPNVQVDLLSSSCIARQDILKMLDQPRFV
ncbi:MAG: hypothetical protein WBP26_02035 [Candidatus Saccharimonadales bacterium]